MRISNKTAKRLAGGGAVGLVNVLDRSEESPGFAEHGNC